MPLPPIGLSLSGLSRDKGRPWSAGPRHALEWAADLGFRRVQLDATAAGVRPRELDRSARRDLASLLRRLELAPCGIDLLIPPGDFADPARVERALAALGGAVDLAADLGALAGDGAARRVCVALPRDAAVETLDAIRARASARGTVVADLAAPAPDIGKEGDPIAPGLDPASILLAGGDPAADALRAAGRIAAARLSDADGAARVPHGSRGSRLDRIAYLAALDAAGYRGPVVLDLRGLRDQDRAARDVLAAWIEA